MNGISILYIFLILLLAIVFIVGIIILFVGLLKKDKKNSTTKKGLIFMSIPIGIVAILLLYEFSHDKFTKKPTDKDLVGVYHIVGVPIFRQLKSRVIYLILNCQV